MSLRTTTIDDLKAEAQLLRSEIERIDSKLRELQTERTRASERNAAIAKLTADEPVSKPILAGSNGADNKVPATSLVNKNLREAIRIALSEGTAMRATEITDVLNRGGFTVSGNTKLAVRVSTELYRMAKSKKIIRDRGRYRCNKVTDRDERIDRQDDVTT